MLLMKSRDKFDAEIIHRLDKAAADLSARVVPLVKNHLATLAKPAVVETQPIDSKIIPRPLPRPAAPTLVVDVDSPTTPELLRLRQALERELPAWVQQQRYAANVTLYVRTFKIDSGTVPTARARVQVRIKDTKFDRIVRTDTIVGDKSFTPDQLAARTAREVLAILRPHLRRALPVR